MSIIICKSFWTNLLLNYLKFNDIKLQQVNFLKDLMSGFKVCKKIKKLENESEKTVDDILLKSSTSKRVNKIYLQAKLFLKIV